MKDYENAQPLNYKRRISSLARWNLTPFAGGWIFRDFVGDTINLYELVNLLIAAHNFVRPYFWLLWSAVFPALVVILHPGFFWV